MTLLVIWAWVPADSFIQTGCQRSNNAAWISVDWTSQPIDEQKVAALAKRAEDHQLAYLYPYVSYVKKDGSFSESYAYANEFAQAFRQHNETTKLLAWVGVPVANERAVGIGGWVNLSNKAERQSIVAFVDQLLVESDFDGVHLNVETVRDQDKGYLLLLQETKNQIGQDRLLSIASTYWLPRFINDLPILDGYRWSSSYYSEIAKWVDQIVTMTYDSFTPHPIVYRTWMREQVRAIRRAVVGSKTELLIGLSVSDEETLAHNPKVESIEGALAGYCAAMSKQAQSHPISGVAIYAEWEANEDEWATWQRWLKSR